jgi:ubiquinone/menaquinone biosynthesis C-methylase UbiE
MGTPVAITIPEGYERWAPSYPQEPGNPLMRAEQQLMLGCFPAVAGRRVLDLACGSGRYVRLLRAAGAAEVVALDASAGMLRRVSGAARVCASMARLPFGAGAFDVVVSGLAIGHAADLGAWMAEVARVLKPGGTCLYSDFHPQAAQAGLTRSFTDELQRSYTLPHFTHPLAAQRAAASAAGLVISMAREVRVGIELTESFHGSESFYQRWPGLPLVLVVRADKP